MQVTPKWVDSVNMDERPTFCELSCHFQEPSIKLSLAFQSIFLVPWENKLVDEIWFDNYLLWETCLHNNQCNHKTMPCHRDTEMWQIKSCNKNYYKINRLNAQYIGWIQNKYKKNEWYNTINTLLMCCATNWLRLDMRFVRKSNISYRCAWNRKLLIE